MTIVKIIICNKSENFGFQQIVWILSRFQPSKNYVTKG